MVGATPAGRSHKGAKGAKGPRFAGRGFGCARLRGHILLTEVVGYARLRGHILLTEVVGYESAICRCVRLPVLRPFDDSWRVAVVAIRKNERLGV